MGIVDILSNVVGGLLVILGFLAVNSKSLSKSIIYLSGLSMLSVLGFVVMKAPDVAVTEAVIGSGLATSLFVFTLLSTRKVVKK